MVECVALNVCCQKVSFDYNKLKRITSDICASVSVSVYGEFAGIVVLLHAS